MDGITTTAIIAAYLLGSISSAVLISRLLRLPDPRTQGSKNPGATNILRLAGTVPALSTLLFDMLKGTIPVWGAYHLGVDPIWLGVIAIAACIGHMFPLFHRFRGGKAVATALGALMPIGLDLGALLIATWVTTLRISGFSSLASLVTIILAPLFVWLIKPLYTLPVLMLAALMIARHHANIVRLLNHTEPKVWQKSIKS